MSQSNSNENSVESDDNVQILESQVNNDDRSPGDDTHTDQTSNSETEKLFSVVPFSTKSSAAWKQFKKGHGPKAGFAKCKHGFKVLKTSGGSTKGLISHLLSAHHIVIPSSNNRAQPTKRQRTDSAWLNERFDISSAFSSPHCNTKFKQSCPTHEETAD